MLTVSIEGDLTVGSFLHEPAFSRFLKWIVFEFALSNSTKHLEAYW